MEKSDAANYDGSVSPSASTIIVSEQIGKEDFIKRSSVGEDPRFVDTGFQHDFGQKTTQHSNAIPSFMPHEPDSNDSYCGRLFKNRRQASSVAAGLSLMINSGLHIGWGIWRSSYFGVWTFSLNSSLFIFMIMAWSVGAFIGGFAGSLLTPVLRKTSIYHLSGAILVVGNVILIVLDEYAEAIAAARILLGAAHGVGYVALIAHAGENAAKNMRGTILSIVNCMLYTGIFAAVIITGTVQYNWLGFPITISGDRVVGCVGVVLAVVSIGFAMMMTVESVPFLLIGNWHENARINLVHLRGSSHETLKLTQEMEEFHLMIAQDKHDNSDIFIDGNGKPLALTILMRIMVAMTNNYLINIIVISYVFQMFNSDQYRLVPLCVVAPRLAMSFIQIFYADVFKRKIQIIVSSMFAGILLIIIGIVLNTVRITSYGQLWTATVAIAVLWLIFQFSCSMGMDQMQDVYLSEAFSMAKKKWSLPFVAGIEHLFHIFMIGMFFVGFNTPAHLYAIIFVTGFVVLLLGIILVVVLPETRNLTLKQANDSFKNYSINLKSPFA